MKNHKSGVVYSPKTGKPVGRWQGFRNPLEGEMRFIRDFLMNVSKQKGELNMSVEEKTEVTNMVWIAGTLRTIKERSDDGVFLLVDVGENSKFIPCTVYKSPELRNIVRGFREGDFIKIQGFARAYSQQKDGNWVNSMNIQITAVKNKPPRRDSPKQQEFGSDDFMPF